ncbi:MAG: M13 family peptidase [Lachnospiraceae bacterium]|nr:M13 family peptidase [Lachnospiraceae bacterium]
MESIRIQDDLYNYVNQEWLEKAVIPDDKPTTGGFADLAKGVEDTMIDEFKTMSDKKSYPNDYLKKTIELFDMVRDTEKRNAEGVAPALKLLNRIKNIKDMKDFNKKLPAFVEEGFTLPFSLEVSEDMMDTTKHSIMLSGPSIILPDTKYYLPEMAPQKAALLGAWSDMVSKLLAFTDLSEDEQKQYLADTLAFDEKIAALVKSHEEWSEYTKCYNPMTVSKVNSLMKPVAVKKLVAKLFEGKEVENIIVAEPRYFKNFKTVFNEETFELYKHWAYVNELLSATGVLSEELRALGSTYRLMLTGVSTIPEVDKYAYLLSSSYFNEPVGLYYGEKYFGEEAKKDVIDMVKDIVETYKNRISKNDFLSEATKEKAILKLNKIGLKMAYPDKVDPLYEKLTVDTSASLYENVCNLTKIKRADAFSKLGTPVDRTKWVMPGHMVNACYNPSLNDITFPAAILQAPFYSIKQSRSQNLGGIGAVIAHEISHAFDNNGAKCDENGNLKNWWTKEDFKKFNARTKAMIREFDGIELPWGTVNGKFIVSENIADNGGMAATLEVMSKMENADYEAYFVNWAKVWCMKARPDYLKLLLSIDVHGPAILRANMQPRNFDEWYTTFKVKKTDKMYLAPSKRVHIW